MLLCVSAGDERRGGGGGGCGDFFQRTRALLTCRCCVVLWCGVVWCGVVLCCVVSSGAQQGVRGGGGADDVCDARALALRHSARGPPLLPRPRAQRQGQLSREQDDGVEEGRSSGGGGGGGKERAREGER
eukprot:985605-Rhodomonas_salina.2